MPPVDGEIQRRLREYEAPTWGYRKGDDGKIESDVFDGELPEGCADGGTVDLDGFVFFGELTQRCRDAEGDGHVRFLIRQRSCTP